MRILDRPEIEKIIPHRAPMLLVDTIECFQDGCIGYYTVRGDEYFLQGHFPGNPIVPGVILIEMMAQSSCGVIVERDCITLFTSINNTKFRNQVKPGDKVKLTCNLQRKKGMFYFLTCSAHVNETLCAVADISVAAIENKN